MRRLATKAGLIVAAMGGTVWIWRSRRATTRGVPGALPGLVGSRLTTWLNRGIHSAMADALGIRPDDELLDVGCGEGAFLAERAKAARWVAGVDLSEPKVTLARRRLARRIEAGTAEVVMADAAALPWPADRFSAVTSMDAFPLFPDPQGVLSEIRRVLRSGGRAVMQIGWRVPDTTSTHLLLGAFRVWNEAEVRRMTEAAGFDDVSVSYAPVGGDSRILNVLGRLTISASQIRIVSAVKPVPATNSPEPAPAGVGR